MGSGMDYFFAINVGDRCPLRGLTVSVDSTWVQGVRFVDGSQVTDQPPNKAEEQQQFAA